MLQRARTRCAGEHRRNVVLYECDAADFAAPEPLDGVLFCLCYNTMPHHRAVLRRAWKALRPGGRLVIMDGRLPSGRFAKWLLPFSVRLMKHTMLGNPLIQPWRELAALCDDVEMRKYLFGSCYICRAEAARRADRRCQGVEWRRCDRSRLSHRGGVTRRDPPHRA